MPGPTSPIAQLAPPIEGGIGVPGVRIFVGATASQDCRSGTTTDATGRFHVTVTAGTQLVITSRRDGALFSLPVPPGNSPLVTSINFAVATDDG